MGHEQVINMLNGWLSAVRVCIVSGSCTISDDGTKHSALYIRAQEGVGERSSAAHVLFKIPGDFAECYPAALSSIFNVPVLENILRKNSKEYIAAVTKVFEDNFLGSCDDVLSEIRYSVRYID